MKKIFAERFLIGMTIGFMFGFSNGLWSLGSFIGLIQDCLVGSFVGGCVGLLFTKKALTWVLELFGKIGGF
jgi:hypothetical protein